MSDTGTKASIAQHTVEELLHGTSFCMAPWVHLFVTQKGNVTPCCRIATPLANVNRDALPDIWNGEGLRALRRKFLSGERDERCWRCYAHERAGSESYRHFMNTRFAHHADWVEETGAEGSVTTARPIYWDIRFSNICNFRCRTCWHGSSSRWFGDAVALGQQVAENALIQNVEDSASFIAALQGFAPGVEEIVFAGGEPLITDEHYRIIQDLIAHDIRNLKLRYVTNLSELRYKSLDIVSLWNRFEAVEVRASLDGIGGRGELIRKELSWPRFVENVRRVRKEAPHVRFGIDVTVSVLNLFQLPDMITTLLDEGLVEVDRLTLRPLHDPSYYNIKIFPAAFKGKALAMIERQLAELDALGAERADDAERISALKAELSGVTAFLTSEDLSHHVPQFARVTKAMDALRAESCFDLCPELRPLIDQPYRLAGLRLTKLAQERMMGLWRRALHRLRFARAPG